MADKSHRKMRKEWKKINDIKEIKSKKNFFVIVFWIGLMVYSILSLSLSILSLFENYASADVYMNGTKIASDYWYRKLSGWAYSSENKVIKMIIDCFMLLYITYLYQSLIRRRTNPSSVYFFLLIILVNVAYRASALPSYNEAKVSKDEILALFKGSQSNLLHSNAVFTLKENFMGWISINNFLIRIIFLTVPIGISSISLISILMSSNIDRIIIR